MNFALNFINVFFEILTYLIFAKVLMSLLRVNPSNRFYVFLSSIVDPILRIAKKVTPRTGMLDFSPVVALIGLEVIRYLITYLLVNI